ncbi:MAG TPA: sugar transferase [Gemmatimonadaceae bacterium]|jgi:lipopolysaccharide/colanic/teichoic acid biosynthesis glycosyltransferase|nr:sugar transferase [Gemmatimonadaceae bacterium]
MTATPQARSAAREQGVVAASSIHQVGPAGSLPNMYPVLKRVFDLVVSAAALVALSPVLVVLSALIKAHDGGPVLYAGRRVGKDGTPFGMYKFRSMVLNADTIGGSSTPDDDPRITPIGRFLRRYKLDELPQFLNVLRGEMSIVGPRPQVQWAVDLYTPEQRQVLTVKPGITDYASVRFPNEGEILKGSTDPDRDYMEKIHPEKMRLSLEYVRNRSMRTDLQVIAQTALAILR